MSNDKYKLSEWRANPLTIKSNEYFEAVFMDTAPNVFYLQNPYESPIYASIGNIPTVDRHEFEIKAKRGDVLGRPLPTKRLYILNPSSEEMTVTLYSNYQEFDIGLLKDMYVEIDTSQFKYDGAITGFKPGISLPVTTLPGKPLEVTGSKLTDIVDGITAIKNWITTKWVDGSFAEKNSTGILNQLGNILTRMNNGLMKEANSDVIASNTLEIREKLTNGWSNGSFVEKNSTALKEQVDLLKNTVDQMKVMLSATNGYLSEVQGITRSIFEEIYTPTLYTHEYIYDHKTDVNTATTYHKGEATAVIKVITNDGTNPIHISFLDGGSPVFELELRAGETISDITVLGEDVVIDPVVVQNISYRLTIIKQRRD